MCRTLGANSLGTITQSQDNKSRLDQVFSSEQLLSWMLVESKYGCNPLFGLYLYIHLSPSIQEELASRPSDTKLIWINA